MSGVDGWHHYEVVSTAFVDAEFGSVSCRVHVSQLRADTQPQVQLTLYLSAPGLAVGFFSPDAADRIANDLKAAAEKARAMGGVA